MHCVSISVDGTSTLFSDSDEGDSAEEDSVMDNSATGNRAEGDIVEGNNAKGSSVEGMDGQQNKTTKNKKLDPMVEAFIPASTKSMAPMAMVTLPRCREKDTWSKATMVNGGEDLKTNAGSTSKYQGHSVEPGGGILYI